MLLKTAFYLVLAHRAFALNCTPSGPVITEWVEPFTESTRATILPSPIGCAVLPEELHSTISIGASTSMTETATASIITGSGASGTATSSSKPTPSVFPGPSGDSILGCHPERPPTVLTNESVTKEVDRFITRRVYSDGSTVTIDENGGKSLKITTIRCPDGSNQIATEHGDRSETIRVTESTAKGLRIFETERQGVVVSRAAVDIHIRPSTTASNSPLMTEIESLPLATSVQTVQDPKGGTAVKASQSFGPVGTLALLIAAVLS